MSESRSKSRARDRLEGFGEKGADEGAERRRGVGELEVVGKEGLFDRPRGSQEGYYSSNLPGPRQIKPPHHPSRASTPSAAKQLTCVWSRRRARAGAVAPCSPDADRQGPAAEPRSSASQSDCSRRLPACPPGSERRRCSARPANPRRQPSVLMHVH